MIKTIKEYLHYRKLKREYFEARRMWKYYTDEIVIYSHNYSNEDIDLMIVHQLRYSTEMNNLKEELLK